MRVKRTLTVTTGMSAKRLRLRLIDDEATVEQSDETADEVSTHSDVSGLINDHSDEEEEEVEYDEPVLYCICNQPDDGRPYIACDECGRWEHFHCIPSLQNRTPEEMEYDEYKCTLCIAQDQLTAETATSS